MGVAKASKIKDNVKGKNAFYAVFLYFFNLCFYNLIPIVP